MFSSQQRCEVGRAPLGTTLEFEVIRAAASFNNTMPRMRASHSGQSRFECPWQLARTSDGDRWRLFGTMSDNKRLLIPFLVLLLAFVGYSGWRVECPFCHAGQVDAEDSLQSWL